MEKFANPDAAFYAIAGLQGITGIAANCAGKEEENIGITTLNSPHSFADTVQRLQAAFADKGIKVFASIDQKAEAEAVGLNMPPTTLILFGNPKAGTPLMVAEPLAALDLPLKVLVSEATPGKVKVSFNTAAYILARHSLPADFAKNIAPAEQLITAVVQK